MKAYMMVEPTKDIPRFLRSLEILSEMGVDIGTSSNRNGLFISGLWLTKSQM